MLGFFDDEASTAGLRAALGDPDGAVRDLGRRYNIFWSNIETLKPAIALIIFWRYLGFNLVLYHLSPADETQGARDV